MRIHNPLDKILDSEVKVRILRFLGKTEAEWSGRQIAKAVNTSPVTCHKALKELTEEKVVLFKTVGRSYLYRLNKGNTVVSELLRPLYEKEGDIPGSLYKVILEGLSPGVSNKIVSMAVFGSVQRKNESPSSDIDLLVLVKNAKDKEGAEEMIAGINGNILNRFGNTVSAYIQTIDELKENRGKKQDLVESILKSHNLIFGKPLKELL